MFKKFKKNSCKIYELCPSDYLTAPALSWHAMFTMTKVELELITSPDMYILFEKDMRQFLIFPIGIIKLTISV